MLIASSLVITHNLKRNFFAQIRISNVRGKIHASDGWFDTYREISNIKFKKLSGENVRSRVSNNVCSEYKDAFGKVI